MGRELRELGGDGSGEKLVPEVHHTTGEVEIIQPGQLVDGSFDGDEDLPEVASYDAATFGSVVETAVSEPVEVVQTDNDLDNGFGDEVIEVGGPKQDVRKRSIIGALVESVSTLRSDRYAESGAEETHVDSPAGVADEPQPIALEPVAENIAPAIPEIPGLVEVQGRRVRDVDDGRRVGLHGDGLGLSVSPDPNTLSTDMPHPVRPTTGDPLLDRTGVREELTDVAQQADLDFQDAQELEADILPFEPRLTREEKRAARQAAALERQQQQLEAQQARQRAEMERIRNFQAVESHQIDSFVEAGAEHRFFAGDVEDRRLLGLENFGQVHYFTRAMVAANLARSSGVEWGQANDRHLLTTEARQAQALIANHMGYAAQERGVDMDTELDASRRAFVINRAKSAVEVTTERALLQTLPSIYQGTGELVAPPTEEAIREAKKRGLPIPEQLRPQEVMRAHREQAFLELADLAGLVGEGPYREYDIAEGSRTIAVYNGLVPDQNGVAVPDARVRGIEKLERLIPMENNTPSGANFMVEGTYKPPGKNGGFVFASWLRGPEVAPMFPDAPEFPGRNGLPQSTELVVGDSSHGLPATRTVMEVEVRHLTDPAYAWLGDANLETARRKGRQGERGQLETVYPERIGVMWAEGLWNNVIPALVTVSERVKLADEAAIEAHRNSLGELSDHILLQGRRPRQQEIATTSGTERLQIGSQATYANAIEASGITVAAARVRPEATLGELVTGVERLDMATLVELQAAEEPFSIS